MPRQNLTRRSFATFLAGGFVSLIGTSQLSIPMRLFSKGSDWLRAKLIFYSEVPDRSFSLINVGEWVAESPANKNDAGKNSVTCVYTFNCPRRMTYFEFIEYSRTWIDWPSLDKALVDDVESGVILKTHFKFDGLKSISTITFKSYEHYKAHRFDILGSTEKPYPGFSRLLPARAESTSV